jgi:hypothetical protein
MGGLGVHDLEVKHLALLAKWIFKLLTEDSVWQTIVKRKYIGSLIPNPLKIGSSNF